MLTSNDINQIQRLIAGNYTETYTDTSDATPVTVWSYELTANELVSIEVICRAMSTAGGFVSRLAKNYFYNGGAVEDSGAFWGYITKEYLGALTTCDFEFQVTGNVVEIVWTGEAATEIRANFKILVHQTVNITAF